MQYTINSDLFSKPKLQVNNLPIITFETLEGVTPVPIQLHLRFDDRFTARECYEKILEGIAWRNEFVNLGRTVCWWDEALASLVSEMTKKYLKKR